MKGCYFHPQPIGWVETHPGSFPAIKWKTTSQPENADIFSDYQRLTFFCPFVSNLLNVNIQMQGIEFEMQRAQFGLSFWNVQVHSEGYWKVCSHL